MRKYPRTTMFLQLEAIQQIAGHDYRGLHPSHVSLWKQVNDVHLNTLGIERAPRMYREMVPPPPTMDLPYAYAPHKVGACCRITGVMQLCLTCKSKLGKDWMRWKPEKSK